MNLLIFKTTRSFSAAAASLIIVLGILAYSNSFSASFQFDDAITILDNHAIRNFNNFVGLWESFNTRFLTGLSFAFNYAIGKLDSAGYHAVNLFIHMLCALCVYWLVTLIFETSAMRKSELGSQSMVVALFASLIFLTHPLQTEAVTYITQRSSLLGGLFYLLAVSCYIRFRLADKTTYRTAALLFSILGMFSKEMTLTIPFALIVCELFFFGFPTKIKEAAQKVRLLAPFILTVFFIPLSLFSDRSSFSVLHLRQEISTIQFNVVYFLTQINVLCTYLRLLFLPINQNLDYDYPLSAGILSLSTFPCLLVLIGIVFFALRMFWRERLFSFCSVWFFLTISVETVVCMLVARDMIYEHYLYLPMAGFSIFISAGVFKWTQDKGKTAILLLSGIILILMMLTYQRNRIWQDPLILWQDVVRKSPEKPRALINLGVAYNRSGQYEKAIDCYYRSVAVYLKNASADLKDDQWPMYIKNILNDPLSANSRGIEDYLSWYVAYQQREGYPLARNKYRDFLSPKNLATWYTNLASVYGNKRDYDKEIEYGLKAVVLNPRNALGFSNLGLAYAQKGNGEESLKYLTKALKLDPYLAQGYNNFGFFYAERKEYARARQYFQKTLELNPLNDEAKQNLNFVENKLKGL